MPAFNYTCESCEDSFDHEIEMKDAMPWKNSTPCSKCGGKLHFTSLLKDTNKGFMRSGFQDNTGRLDTRKVPTDFKNLMDGMHKMHKQEYKG